MYNYLVMPDPVYLNVAIAAEQAIVRRGLSAMIQSVNGVRLLGEARNLQEVQELCSLVAPDLLLLDYISLEQARTAVSAIRQRHPNARALLLVDPIEQECV